MTNSLSRRHFLAYTAALPAGMTVWQAAAQAADAAAKQLPLDDPRVPALGYVTDAAKAKADPMFKPGSNCGNCAQLKGKAGDQLRPCALFPDLKNPQVMLLVPVGGWCRSWTAAPKAG